MHCLQSRCGPTATVPSLKLTLNVLIKQFKENGLVPETTVRTQRSRRFPKHDKLLIFGILAHEPETWNLNFHKWLKVTYFMQNEAPMTMPQSKIGYEHYLSSYKHFLARKMTSKRHSKYLCLIHFWKAAAAQWRLWRHWNSLGMIVLIKQFKENGLFPETTVPTQHSRRFFKT